MSDVSDGADFPRLACEGVTVLFGGLAAIDEVSLAVPPAEIVGLVGPNGAGKSTLFGVLSGLLRPVRGTVALDGTDVTHARPQVRAAHGLARTFQHPELFTGLTVREHLVLAYRVKHARRRTWSDLFTLGSLRRSDPAERSAVDELIELLGLGPVAMRSALGLPLGSARLLELGRALAVSPTVVLLDEPSSGLDSAETEQFEQSLRLVNRERQISVLLVEHDVDLVMRLCSSIHVLDFGVLIASGTPEEIHSNPTVRAAYLGEHFSTGGQAPEVEVREVDEATEAREAETALDAADDGLPEAVTAAEGPSQSLSIENLCVRYGEATALTGVSFEVGAGKAVAVLGANGAGKSSLARAVAGLVCPSEGSIALGADRISGVPAHRVRRAGVVYLPETRAIFRTLSVIDNLRMAARPLPDRGMRKAAVERSFELFPALAERRRLPARLLSGGEQQMLSLARALAVFPKVLVADELSLGLAPTIVDVVFDGLARAREAGVTVIMIEQYVHRALDFADDCLVLQRGELVWSGPADDAHEEVLRHYLGDAMVVAS
ncbi:MAG: ATP-binding cassette domain-containing protein [Acidimicrobiales bacterium]